MLRKLNIEKIKKLINIQEKVNAMLIRLICAKVMLIIYTIKDGNFLNNKVIGMILLSIIESFFMFQYINKAVDILKEKIK